VRGGIRVDLFVKEYGYNTSFPIFSQYVKRALLTIHVYNPM
jgi:hypothetical protein